MPNLTHPPAPLAASPPLITEPPYAAQILTVAAWVLELAATTDLTAAGLDDAMQTANAGIVGHLPAAVAETATRNARAALPPYAAASTRGEYALRLRATARGI
ncbi:hypothetical protein [Streptomyces sp. NPDC005732]|uniref:hypothetical protein n=1 Tax=Streptomyces sp. NPDC005732 TaxID=3157057 RepID=UPI0033FAE719